MAKYKEAVAEIIRGVDLIVRRAEAKSTKCYNGLIESNVQGNIWKVKVNGESHNISAYGNVSPSIGKIVKVIIPQGDYSQAFFI